MESENIVLGKINKKKCHLNNGKYGHYLSCDDKNYKVPEWFPVDKFDIDIAERLIEYKKKMSEMYCDDSSKKTTKLAKKDESESEEELPQGWEALSGPRTPAPKSSKKKSF